MSDLVGNLKDCFLALGLIEQKPIPSTKLLPVSIILLMSVSESWQSHLSRLVGKPTMWFLNRSDTNRPVQLQKQARSLKFWS